MKMKVQLINCSLSIQKIRESITSHRFHMHNGTLISHTQHTIEVDIWGKKDDK
jgi:hypothetical protein